MCRQGSGPGESKCQTAKGTSKACSSKRSRRKDMENPDRGKCFQHSCERKSGSPVEGKRRSYEGRRHVHYFQPVLCKRTEIFCFYRRVIYRPGYTPVVAYLFGNRGRQKN